MKFQNSTLFLTFKGWYPISEMGYLDFVSLNLVTNEIQVSPAADIDQLVSKENTHLRLHDDYLYTNTDMESAEQSERIRVANTKVKNWAEYDAFNVRQAYLLGIVLTDAHFTKEGHLEIYQSLKKERVMENISRVLEDLGIEGNLYERNRNGKHYTWRFSRKVSSVILECLDLLDRTAPSFKYLFLPHDARVHLLNALMDGDGTWNDNDRIYGVFYKPKLIDFFQVIAMSLGYKSKVNAHRKQIYISKVGLTNGENWIAPDMTQVKQKKELHELIMASGVQPFSPLLMDNGKIFFGKL